MAVVAAETFGLQPTDIGVHIGHSAFPPSGGSGGSTTIGGVSSGVRTVGEQLLASLFEKVAPGLEATPDDLAVVEGAIRRQSDPNRKLSWTDACRRLGAETLSAEAPRDKSLTTGGVNGAQFAEVEVDTETGIARVVKVVACQDCGLIVNRLTAESQVYGGVIMGIGYALFEERVYDPLSGRMLNPDMEFYKLPGAGDIPEIEVLMQDQPERGVIGLGEPPTVPTAAAIANGVANALGARVHALPLTPDKILAALAAGREA
jgi:xanthine dehydrogenase YagR molybdenum-binding subunit